MAKLDAFFKLMVDQGASDLHLVSGSQPILRVSGELQRVRYGVLESDDLKQYLGHLQRTETGLRSMNTA